MSCLKENNPNEPAIFPINLELELGKEYYWCTCGKSKNQPFCDGYFNEVDPIKEQKINQ